MSFHWNHQNDLNRLEIPFLTQIFKRNGNSATQLFYRPQQLLRKGYVFTGVCLSTGRGGGVPPHDADTLPGRQTPPPHWQADTPGTGRHTTQEDIPPTTADRVFPERGVCRQGGLPRGGCVCSGGVSS